MKNNMRYLKMRLRFLLFIPILFLLLSCKKSRWDISHEPEMAARIDAYVEEMASIADAFPKEPKPLEPGSVVPLRFWESWKCNAMLIDRWQLAFVDSDWGFAKEDYFEVGVGYNLADFFDGSNSGEQEAPEGYRQELEDILGIRYLVVTDIFYDTPVFVEKKSEEDRKSWENLKALFTGGEASGKVAVYDRETGKWVGGFKCEAKPPESVEFEVDEEWHFKRDLPYYVRSRTENTFEACIRERLKPFIDDSNSSSALEETLPDSPE